MDGLIEKFLYGNKEIAGLEFLPNSVKIFEFTQLGLLISQNGKTIAFYLHKLTPA